jgi:hypothetical protein
VAVTSRVKRRGCLANVLIAGLSTLLTLFLLDSGIRAVWHNRIFTIEYRPDVPQVYRFPPGRTRHAVIHGDQAGPNDPIIQSWTVDWVTDAYGYRNAAIPARIDTLVLGDSFGSETVSQNDLVASRLTTCGRSVYNLSVVRHGPWQEYATLMLEQDRLNLKPGTSLLWILFSGNDMDDVYLPVYGDAIKTDLTHQGPEPYIADYILGSPLLQFTLAVLDPQQYRVVDPTGGWQLYYAPYVAHARRTADDIRALPNYPLLRDTFHALAADARQRQMKPLVIVVPSKEEVYYYRKASGFGAVIAGLSAEDHLPVIDLTPIFLDLAASGDYLYFAQDTHWNEHAQQIVAQMLCQYLGDGG